MPSPSGSSVAADPGQSFVQPKCSCCHCWNGVNCTGIVKLATALVALPAELLTTAEYEPRFVDCTLEIEKVALEAPSNSELVLKYHWYVNGALPEATTVNEALCP